MNIEHRTSNIERRIMYSVYIYKRLSEAIPSFDTCPPPEDSIFDTAELVAGCGSAVRFYCSFIRAPPLAAGVQSNLRRNLMSYEVSGVRELRRCILTPEH
jgi:hypothetical protein